MDLPVLLLVAALLLFGVAAGGLVWHLTPDRPRIWRHPQVTEPATSPGPEPPGPSHQWAAPAVVRPAPPAPVEPEEEAGGFVYEGERERIPLRTRALGLAGAVILVLVGAVAIASAVYFAGRIVFEQVDRYIGGQ